MTATPPYGLSPLGYRAKRLARIVDDLNQALIAQFGAINLAPQSVYGQLVGVEAKAYADLWENSEQVYNSQYPNTATGVSLDNIVALNGITRLPQTQTEVYAACTGNEGTFITVNALAKIPNTNDNFYTPNGGIITAQRANNVTVTVGTVGPQAYQVLLNNVTYVYSLPLVTFTGNFVTGNVIVPVINGVAAPTVNFTTDHDTTITLVAASIATLNTVVASAVVGGVNTNIQITPVLGQSVAVNSISITGGASQPTFVTTFTTPANANAISSNLTAQINNTVGATFVAANNSGVFTVTANSARVPFSIAVGTNQAITVLASPIVFLSQNFGPQACPANSLTQILTPINGWISITNPQDGVLGRFTETDAQLRLRRLNSLYTGNATVDAIRSKVVNVPGVDPTSVSVFENTSFTEQPLVINFSAALVAGQNIHVVYNVSNAFDVPFNTDMATTMADLVTAFQALPQVASAAASGGNLIMTVNMNIFQQLVIASGGVTVTGTGTLPTAVTYGGLPPKSFEVIVEGGDNQAIGLAIWLAKPAGIQSFGNTQVTIVDSQGQNQVVFFTRPLFAYLWVIATLTLDGSNTYPVNGDTQVAAAILAYGNTLVTGEDVFIQRVQAQVFQVPGIASAVIQLASTISPNSPPSYGTVTIPIASNQIAVFDAIRITVTH